MLLLGAGLSVTPARASVPGGCAGTLYSGRSDAVGWIDLDVMAQLGDGVPPALFEVQGPDGSRASYVNGAGLEAPTPAMPIWLAPVTSIGTYTLIIDGGYDCVVEVTADGVTNTADGGEETTSDTPIIDPNVTIGDETFWEARTAPVLP